MTIPTMNLFTIKNDKEGNPVRAKSRIVALGNLEKRIWSRGDRYAPVLSSTASQLLLSMAVSDGRKLKQGDCKNAFCNGILPEDEICIVKPPLGCPRSTGSYWKLNKNCMVPADQRSIDSRRYLGFSSMICDSLP